MASVPSPRTQSRPPKPRPWESIGTDWRGYPQDFAQREIDLIHQRRKAHSAAFDYRQDVDDRIGLALSGGGIRSATFSLGLLQALARAGLLKRFDYLSTVSGGGYVGAFLGALYNRLPNFVHPPGQTTVAPAAAPPDRVESLLADSMSSPMQQLRRGGRYLAPNGAGDVIASTGAYLRGLFSLQFLLFSFFLMLFLAGTLARGAAFQWLGRVWDPGLARLDAFVWTYFWISPFWFLLSVPALGALFWMLYFWGFALFTRDKSGRHERRSTNFLRGCLLMAIALAAFALIDSAGQTLYAMLHQEVSFRARGLAPPASLSRYLAAIFAALGLVAPFIQKIASLTVKGGASGRLSIPRNLLAYAGGMTLGFILLASTATLAHAVRWQGTVPCGDPAAKITNYIPGSSPAAGLSAETTPGATQDTRPAVAAAGVARSRMTFLDLRLEDQQVLFWGQVTALLVALAASLSVRLGRPESFVNAISLQNIYKSRLRRAYLGAANPARWTEPYSKPVTRPHEDDGVPFSDYKPHLQGGPLHLINMTLNETFSGYTRLEHRDQKGLMFSLGPAGAVASVDHAAPWTLETQGVIQPAKATRYHFFYGRPAEDNVAAGMRTLGGLVQRLKPTPGADNLHLEDYIAISGAAVSTGMGLRSSFGLAVLLGLLNIRLGSWWDSGVDPKSRAGSVPGEKGATPAVNWGFERVFPAHALLLSELTSRYFGPARRHWYLSDGGHFENTGIYELIRRRVPLIVASDNGCDPLYRFSDLGELVRHCRIDFGAEIRFLTEGELNDCLGHHKDLRLHFGTLEQLRRGERTEPRVPLPPLAFRNREDNVVAKTDALSLACASLARIDYGPQTQVAGGRDRPDGWLVVIKPALVGDEPADLAHYHQAHPDFPQQTTGDQFFDEPQWESYRLLGEHIATKLFADDRLFELLLGRELLHPNTA